MTKTVYVYVNRRDMPENLKQFITFWEAKLNAIPEEYRDSAGVEFNVESDGSGLYLEVEISYEREETPEEIKAGEEMLRKSRELTEARERHMLKQLKEKYE